MATANITSPSPALSRPVWLCVTAMLLAGLGSLAILGQRGPVPPLEPFLVWTLMLVGAECIALDLPGGGFVTVGGVLDYAGILCFGPLLVGWADVTSVLICQGLWRRKPLSRVMFNAGLYALTSASAGTLYVALGGVVGSTHFSHSVLPLLALGGVYFGVNSAGVSAILSLTEQRGFFQQWRDNFRWALLQHWSMLPLGVLLAVLTISSGLWSVTLTAAPLLLARYSFLAYLRSRSDLKDFVRAISGVLDAVDPYTREHSLRVAAYSVRVARELGLPGQEVEMVEYAALMHDLGKITTDARALISKPGLLTREEKQLLNSHPVVGAAIFEQVRSLRRAADYVRAHHERLDGRGYPRGLRGEEIPMGARILTVCDCYDAMTSDRPYMRARSSEMALAELVRHSGTQFDALVVDCFCRLHEQDRVMERPAEPAPAPAPAYAASAPAARPAPGPAPVPAVAQTA